MYGIAATKWGNGGEEGGVLAGGVEGEDRKGITVLL